MLINSTLIFCLIPELKDALMGLRIASVRTSSDQKELLFSLRGRNEEIDLYFSAHALDCRIEMWKKDQGERRKDYQKTNLFWFAVGGYVRGVEQLDFDRLINISCEKKTQFGRGQAFDLVFELTGRNSNVVLVKKDGRIIDCLRKIDAARNRLRQILPGEKYLPPPPPKKRAPLFVGGEEFCKLIKACNKPTSECLISGFMGLDEFLSQKIIPLSPLDPKKKGSELSVDEVELMWRAFRQTFEKISNYDLSFQIVVDAEGVPKAISCLDLPFVPDERKIRCENLSSAVESFFFLRLERENRREESHKLSLAVKRALRKLKHRAERIEDDLQQAEKFEQYKRFGELLMMNKHSIKKGRASVKLTDVLTPTHSTVEIPLDPKFSAVRNAQSYFKKYRKARDALEVIEKRKKETKDNIACLEEISGRLKEYGERADLDEIRRSLTQLGLLKESKAPTTRGKRKEFSARRFLTQSGWEIYVGRNNKENDYLTFRFARPHDLWFHAQDVPGSHVLLRKKDKRTEPSTEQIREAAKIAAYFSKARGEKKAAVIYTQAKYVRKPKKAKPGLALVEREKTILIKPGLPGKNART